MSTSQVAVPRAHPFLVNNNNCDLDTATYVPASVPQRESNSLPLPSATVVLH
ncbi:hypothetical protein PISMIDRAFT_675664 [Pisolithus microcarpus 441]|uniref:Uncharacterized protein n=1 Tax=Pisolithus microcarpus 441 TaxID=765257 RepID=A0A0D0A3U8_9AGAM|nr:hypothetical protein PISMIDRAFT_675664 [Pisolithus microcarpus 441]